MAALTLAIVGETLFSSNVQSDADEVRDALTAAVQSFGIVFLPGLEYFEKLPLPVFARVRKARERLDRVIHRVIAERRSRRVCRQRLTGRIWCRCCWRRAIRRIPTRRA